MCVSIYYLASMWIPTTIQTNTMKWKERIRRIAPCCPPPLSSSSFSCKKWQKSLLVPNMLETNVSLLGVQSLKEISLEHKCTNCTYSLRVLWRLSSKILFANLCFLKEATPFSWKKIFERSQILENYLLKKKKKSFWHIKRNFWNHLLWKKVFETFGEHVMTKQIIMFF